MKNKARALYHSIIIILGMYILYTIIPYRLLLLNEAKKTEVINVVKKSSIDSANNDHETIKNDKCEKCFNSAVINTNNEKKAEKYTPSSALENIQNESKHEDMSNLKPLPAPNKDFRMTNAEECVGKGNAIELFIGIYRRCPADIYGYEIVKVH